MQAAEFTDQSTGRLVVIDDGACAFVPAPLPPNLELGWSLVGAITDADHALGRLDGAGARMANPFLLVSPVQRREAILSNRIEGTITYARQLALFQADALTDGSGTVVEDAREVANYVSALAHGLGSPLPICLRLLRECHAKLLDGVRGADKTPGQFRRVQNAIGSEGDSFADARFVPPPPSELPAVLDAFERFLHASDDLPLVVRLALVHYQFEAIHPFLDGNGRLGRLLVPLMLQRAGRLAEPLLYMSAYFERHRRTYVDAMRAVSTRAAWGDWLRFFLTGVVEQANDAIARIERLDRLRSEWHASVRSRGGGRARDLVDLLFERPAMRIPQVAERLEVTFKGAQNMVEKLVQLGILEEITGASRNRVYLANEILRTTDE